MAAPGRRKRLVRRAAIELERRWDDVRRLRRMRRSPEHFRIETYAGHGSRERVRVRGRVLDNPEPAAALAGESTWAAALRTVQRFLTDELPGVPLAVQVGGAVVGTASDPEGYFDVELEPGAGAVAAGSWLEGEVRLAAPYRGLTDPHPTPVRVRLSGPQSEFGVISDVDDTILVTGAQRLVAMVRQTVTGSALTRMPFAGAPELYRALAGTGTGRDQNPVCYVSSSPWNLHAFLTAFLEHRGFPAGPLLLRDLLGTDARRTHASHKSARIEEVLGLHPDLSFVLIGDSGQHDPEIYAEVVRRNPGRIVAVYIREVRLNPADRRVETILDDWREDVPFVLASDSAEVARHAAGLGLISLEEARAVGQATEAG